MKVSQYVTQLVESRPYKPTTKENYLRCIRKIGIWDMDVNSLTAALIMEKVAHVTRRSQNTHLIVVKSLLKDINDCGSVKIHAPRMGKVYDLPSQEVLEWVIEKSPYKLQLQLMMYAGLRLGEACAITPRSLEGHEGNYWLVIDQAWNLSGKILGAPKTEGKVMIPDWLAQEVKNMKPSDYWKKGKGTHSITSHLSKLSKTKQYKALSNNKPVNPHMFRHWFATDMVKRGVNPEIARRQMRHASSITTLMIYTQVRNDDIRSSMPTRPKIENEEKLAKVIKMPLAN